MGDFIIKNSRPWQVGAYYIEIRRNYDAAGSYVRYFSVEKIGKKVTINCNGGLGYVACMHQTSEIIGPMTQREALYYKPQIERQLRIASNSILAIFGEDIDDAWSEFCVLKDIMLARSEAHKNYEAKLEYAFCKHEKVM